MKNSIDLIVCSLHNTKAPSFAMHTFMTTMKVPYMKYCNNLEESCDYRVQFAGDLYCKVKTVDFKRVMWGMKDAGKKFE